MRRPVIPKRTNLLFGLLLVGALAACAAPGPTAGTTPGPRAPAACPSIDPAPAQAWWNTAGDALLSRLVAGGLSANPSLQRRAQALALARARALRLRHGWRQWLAQTLGWPAPRLRARALRLERARQHEAEAIALDYVQVRRLRALLALRLRLQRQFRDDARVAVWRREAGLVSAVDGGLGATMVGLNAAAIDSTRARLATATAGLALRGGMPPQRLRRALAGVTWMPRWRAQAACGAPGCDAAGAARQLAAVAAARARAATLRQLERHAEDTVADARTAYRLGSWGFATLYVAETSVLAVRAERVDARAEVAGASIRLWTDEALARLAARATRSCRGG